MAVKGSEQCDGSVSGLKKGPRALLRCAVGAMGKVKASSKGFGWNKGRENEYVHSPTMHHVFGNGKGLLLVCTWLKAQSALAGLGTTWVGTRVPL